MACLIFFFFFQAEDGIRYTSVTGVQTCALPISLSRVAVYRRGLFRDPREGQLMTKEDSALIRGLEGVVAAETRLRSEERRVGEEGGAGGWRCGCRQK